MKREDAVRLVGTAVLTVATAVPFAAGVWWVWGSLSERLPLPFALLATLGAAIAPVQLVRDVLHADRLDRKAGTENHVEIE